MYGCSSKIFRMAPSVSRTLIKLRFATPIPTSTSKWDPLGTSSWKCSFSTSAGPLSSLPQSFSPSSSQSQAQDKKTGRWSRWLLFLPGAITFGLGTWQIFRRQNKIEMLEYREKRLELEPIPWNGISSSDGDLDSLEFRRVICKGVFDETKSIYLGPRSRSISGVTENGYYVITPLLPLADNSKSVQSAVLVNKGWVPRNWKDKPSDVSQDGEPPPNLPSPNTTQNEGNSPWRFWSKKHTRNQARDITPVKVIGVVRGSEKPSIFVPENNPSSGQWFYVDVPAIARACGLPENTLYIEYISDDINPSKPYPIPKDVNALIRSSVTPQDHLNYTLTWYSLSAAVTFMAVKRVKPSKSRR
ncbi:surfeit locus protein 1 isoform X2 [Telopea speciosissima]|uniref:surfeit locus protein 1 isoform X2 n=1 Tax=Telopea speciosissima TaxID=54955 RepID=UPI001CC6C9E0|nr:surfeit locus protein 1 isoform X2 [Telopea speciosissima]